MTDAGAQIITFLRREATVIKTPYDWPRPEIPYEGSELWPMNAWRDLGIGLEVIDAQHMRVTLANGITLPIVALYDADGFRVEEYAEARTFDFGHPSLGYARANAAHAGRCPS